MLDGICGNNNLVVTISYEQDDKNRKSGNNQILSLSNSRKT